MRFLSGLQDEGIVFSQRERVRGEFIQFGLTQADGRLHVTARLLLAQNVGNVVGAEGACSVGFLHCAGDRFRAVIANQLEQLADLTCQGAVGVGKLSQIQLGYGAEEAHEPLLGGRTLRGSHLRIEFFLETFGPEGLAALPASCIADDLVRLVVDRHGRRVCFNRELVADIAWWHAVAVAIEGQPKIFVGEGLGAIAIVGVRIGNGFNASGWNRSSGAWPVSRCLR